MSKEVPGRSQRHCMTLRIRCSPVFGQIQYDFGVVYLHRNPESLRDFGIPPPPPLFLRAGFRGSLLAGRELEVVSGSSVVKRSGIGKITQNAWAFCYALAHALHLILSDEPSEAPTADRASVIFHMALSISGGILRLRGSAGGFLFKHTAVGQMKGGVIPSSM